MLINWQLMATGDDKDESAEEEVARSSKAKKASEQCFEAMA